MKLETACECECRFRYRRGHGYLVPFLFPSIRLKNIKSHVTLSGWYEACGFIWFHDCRESTIWCKNSVVLWIEYLTYPQKTLGVNGFLSIYRFTKVYKGLNLYRERKPFKKTHKTAINWPVDHILSKVSCFLFKSFQFRRLSYRNDRFFPHSNPYISNVSQQCRCSPMLIFRAWATCAVPGSLFRCLLAVPSPRRVAPYEAKWKRWESVWYAILSDHALEGNGDKLVIEFLRILEESATSWLDIRECYWCTLGWSRK